MKSTKTEGNPSPEDRRRNKALAIGLALVVILISGGVWGSSLSASGTPASMVDATQAGAAPPPPATPTSPTKKAAPGKAAAPAPSTTGQASAPAPSDTGEGSAAAAKGKSEAELAATPQLVSAPVAFTDSASLRPGVTAAVTGFEAVKGEAAGPGEIAGPAIRFTVSVHNQSAQSVSLEGALINVDYGPHRIPALQLSGPGATRFPESVDAGATASAVYVFLLPLDQRGRVRIYLNYEVSSPIAAFTGSVTTSEGKS